VWQQHLKVWQLNLSHRAPIVLIAVREKNKVPPLMYQKIAIVQPLSKDSIFSKY
jgi:hypothetical protein